ncbi:hypothetical protein B0H11DRAFT_83087 [Mycena galericulata]|nr:hypothetical protein B0H11DRAFT_83087 [Mycena galericulata]
MSGRGFHYICIQADGSTMFERRLANAPYPQEFSLEPMFSFQADMDIRLCLSRRPFYIWPIKSIVKFSSLTTTQAHDLLYAAPPEGVEHTFVDVPEISVRLQRENVAAVLEQSKETVSRRRHILDLLGPYRELMENLVKVASSATEMNSIAKSVCGGLGQIYDTLSQLEDWDDKLLDLIEDMARFLVYVNDMKCFVDVGHLQGTMEALDPMIRRTGNLLLKYQRHGVLFLKEMAEYDKLQRRFVRWTQEFREALGLESLKEIVALKARQENFFHKHRADIIESIRPPGIDRQRPLAGCMKGTRESIFTEIESWLANGALHNILWITGFPGSGKSCVAKSLVEKLADTPTFGSSFFFERDGGSFTSPSTMVRKIASDLSRRPVFMEALVADLDARMIDFSTASIAMQFSRLVEKPLKFFAQKLVPGNSLVVVLDAIDECGGLGKFRNEDQEDILALIQRWASFSPFLRLIVTSRRETLISEVLDPISTSLNLELSSEQATRDIEAFLDLQFRRIAKIHRLPNSWPTRDEIRTLAKKANGLFVWATTLVKFVDQPRPQDILQQILGGEINVEGPITDLYELILKMSFYKDGRRPRSRFRAEFNTFIGCIATAKRPLEKTSPLFHILKVEEATASYICAQLRSVLMDDEKHWRFNHQSFVDFLVSDACPSSFRIIPVENMKKTSLSILSTLNDGLRFDPYKFRTSYNSNPGTEAVLKYIPPDICYASKIWGDSLSGDNSGDTEILASLKTFFETKFLYWVEVLSLTGQMRCGLAQLRCAEKWIGCCDLLEIVQDAIDFLEMFQECIQKSAPHVYLSAMSFAPQTSKVYQIYSSSILPSATVRIQTAESLREGRSHIPATVVHSPHGAEFAGDFEGHVDDITSVLITEDGYVASASYDTTIRFWDLNSGAPTLTPFTTHQKPVTSLAFSRDPKILVAGSRDGTVSVWDIESHILLTTLAHEVPVECVAISPTGTTAIIGCKDHSVKFWNISEQRECRSAFCEHTAEVTSVIFLEEGIALSGSVDRTIYLHRISGRSRVLVRGQFPIYSLSVAPSTRTLVAACYSCIAIWDLSDINEMLPAVYLAQDSRKLISVAINGSRIAAAIGNKVEVWDILSGQLVLGPLNGHKESVTSVAFSANGERLVSGSLDRTVRSWDTGSEIGKSLGGFPEGSSIDSNGWIRGSNRELIIWVPRPYRRKLCWGRALAVLGRPGIHLTVFESLLGNRWFQCRSI